MSTPGAYALLLTMRGAVVDWEDPATIAAFAAGWLSKSADGAEITPLGQQIISPETQVAMFLEEIEARGKVHYTPGVDAPVTAAAAELLQSRGFDVRALSDGSYLMMSAAFVERMGDALDTLISVLTDVAS